MTSPANGQVCYLANPFRFANSIGFPAVTLAGWVAFKAGPSQLSCQFAFRSLWPSCITTSFLTAQKLGRSGSLKSFARWVVFEILGQEIHKWFGLDIPEAMRILRRLHVISLGTFSKQIHVASGGYSILDRTCGGLWPLCHLVWLRCQSAHALWSRRATASSEAGNSLGGANKISSVNRTTHQEYDSLGMFEHDVSVYIYICIYIYIHM